MGMFVVVRDDSLCKDCSACVARCKTKNGLKARVRANEHPTLENLRADLKHLSLLTCHHCERPFCLEACPQKAIYKNEAGTVMVEESRCDGCAVCVEACPWHIPFVPEGGPMVKCSHCHGLVTKGKTPECVKACRKGALSLMTIEEATRCLHPRSRLSGVILNQK